MISFTLRKRLAAAAFTNALILTFANPAAAAVSDPQPSRAEVSVDIAQALDAIASNSKIGTDPLVAAELAANATLFVENFCGQPSEQKPFCELTINNPDVLQQIITEYLENAIKRPLQLETLASRLARRVGVKMADVGWLTEFDNDLGVLAIPPNLRSGTLILTTAKGPINLSPGVRYVLLNPGSYLLTEKFPNGKNVSGDVNIGKQEIATWNPQASTVSPQFGRIDAELGDYCDSSSRRPLVPALNAFNWGRGRFVESEGIRLSHLAPAASQPGVEIKVIDETKTCGSDCTTGLGIAFAQAIAIWRSGCAACDANALAVIKLGPNVWLDRRAAERARRMQQSPASALNLDLAKKLPDESSRYFTAPGLATPGSFIVGYEQIDQQTTLVALLCGLTARNSASWVGSAQGFLCPSASPPAMRLRPSLTLSLNGTDCGPAAAAVACGKPGGKIQLALDGYQYRIPTPKRVVLLGSAKGIQLAVGPVVLHEVGHWFGLPHPETVGVDAPDIMEGVFHQDIICVRAESLTMLNNASDDRWQFRATDKLGLRPPAHGPASNQGGTR